MQTQNAPLKLHYSLKRVHFEIKLTHPHNPLFYELSLPLPTLCSSGGYPSPCLIAVAGMAADVQSAWGQAEPIK